MRKTYRFRCLMLDGRRMEENQHRDYVRQAIHVRDLQKSAAFYETILGLKRMPEPFIDRIGGGWRMWWAGPWVSTYRHWHQAEVELVPLRVNCVPRRVKGSSNSSIC